MHNLIEYLSALLNKRRRKRLSHLNSRINLILVVKVQLPVIINESSNKKIIMRIIGCRVKLTRNMHNMMIMKRMRMNKMMFNKSNKQRRRRKKKKKIKSNKRWKMNTLRISTAHNPRYPRKREQQPKEIISSS